MSFTLTPKGVTENNNNLNTIQPTEEQRVRRHG